MAIFNITTSESDWSVEKAESSTDCSTAFTYTVEATNGNSIVMSLSDSFNNGRYYLNGVEAALDVTPVTVVFDTTLTIKFFISNSGQSGTFLDTLVTITNSNSSDADTTYTDTAVRLNDGAACGSDVGCYDCPPYGDGTDNYVVKWDGTSDFQDSIIYGGDAHVGIGTQSSIAGSQFASVTSSTSTGTSVNTWLDVNRAHTATASGATYASVNRVTSNSSFLDGGVVGSNQVGRQSGTGGAEFVYGNLIQSEQTGSGDIDFLSGSVVKVEAKGNGTGTIDYIRGLGINAGITNASTTVNWLQGNHLTCDLTDGTVGNVQVLLLDFDRTGGTITEDFAYLAIVEDVGLHTVGGTAYAIDSKTTLPSEFAGSLSTPLVLAETDNDVVGVTYAGKFKVVKTNTSSGSNGFGVRAEASSNSSGGVSNLFGVLAKATSYGDGDVGYLIGVNSTSDVQAGGDLIGVYAGYNNAKASGADVLNIGTMVSQFNTMNLTNGNATIGNAIGTYQDIALTSAVVTGNVNVLQLAGSTGTATVGGDFNMLKIDEATGTPTVTGTSRAINVLSTLPSVFAGEIKTASDLRVTGSIYDSTDVNGTTGQVLTSTGNGTEWQSLDVVAGVPITVKVLTFAQGMKDLIANPISLIAAPAYSWQVIKILTATMRIQNPGVGFDYTDALKVQYTDGTEIMTLNALSANTNTNKTFNLGYGLAASVGQEVSLQEGIELTTTNNDATVGSGQCSISITYVIHDMNISI